MNEISPRPSHPIRIEIILSLKIRIIIDIMNLIISLKNLIFVFLWAI